MEDSLTNVICTTLQEEYSYSKDNYSNNQNISGFFKDDKRVISVESLACCLKSNMNENAYPDMEILLQREILYQEVRKQEDEQGGREEARRKTPYKPRRIYKPQSKRVGLTKVRLEDCLRCDACSCIYIDEQDYHKHMQNFHQKYNTIIPRTRKSPTCSSISDNILHLDHSRFQITKTSDSAKLLNLNDGYIREKIKSRWNKVSQRLSNKIRIKQEPPDDMSYLLSQVEVKIKTEPSDVE